ncbi:hypothetical protein FRC00_004206 [Tulasnella sp. 408]|nr:hypothetical protein FRC00_004206 [Tulasnella sp. 408]
MASSITSRRPASSKPASRSPSTVEEEVPKFYVPNITTKDLYGAIPISDVAWIAFFLWAALTYIPKINPQNVTLPHPAFYKVAREAAWALYGFCVGLPAMGLWVIAHECGHHAFSTSERANDVIGWIMHSL